MRTLTMRERALGIVASLVVAGVGLQSHRALQERDRSVSAAEAALEVQRARLAQALRNGSVGDGPTLPLRDAVVEAARMGASVTEDDGRFSLAWRGGGRMSWDILGTLARARDASLTSMSVKRAGRDLEVAIALEAPRAP